MAEETYSTDGPTCPYCGDQITPDEGIYFDEHAYTDQDCPSCGRHYSVSVYLSASWTCRPTPLKTLAEKMEEAANRPVSDRW